MSAEAVEAFLARLLADREAVNRFEQDRSGEAARAGLTPDECTQLAAMDLTNLKLAASSAERKRHTVAASSSASNEARGLRGHVVTIAALVGVLVRYCGLFSRAIGGGRSSSPD